MCGRANRTDVAMSRPVLSTHVLDTSTGRPAAALFVELYKKKENSWALWHSTTTTSDGRIQFPFTNDSMSGGTYKLMFKVGDYYKMLDKETIYPFVEVSTVCSCLVYDISTCIRYYISVYY